MAYVTTDRHDLEAPARADAYGVLITEDEPTLASLARGVLETRFRCETAGSVQEAREKLAAGEFAVALCDIQMPGESGWTLGEEIIEQHPHTSVVLMTSSDEPHLAQQAFEAGAHGYLVKPFHRGQLLITVLNALKRRSLEIAEGTRIGSLRQQFQAVIDRAPLPVYVKDRDYRFLIINRASAGLAGKEPPELIGKTVDAMMPPAAAERSRAGDRQVLDGGKVYEEVEHLVIGGESKTMLTTKFPLLDEHGEVYAVCGISSDVTKTQLAERLSDELVVTQRRAIEELRSSRQEMIERLARAVEFRDYETGGHVRRMAAVSAFLGQAVGLGASEVEVLRAAAPMHDVGKIGVPDAILLKPGPLTDDERRQMERHASFGHEILDGSDSELLQLAAVLALTHHERVDGTGYPRGLAGEAIPIEGRIVAVADVFDALLSDRPYRPAMPLAEVLDIVERTSGTHLDPNVADIVLTRTDEVVEVRDRA